MKSWIVHIKSFPPRETILNEVDVQNPFLHQTLWKKLVASDKPNFTMTMHNNIHVLDKGCLLLDIYTYTQSSGTFIPLHTASHVYG